MLLKLGADVKNSTLLQDCGESNINYSRDLVMLGYNQKDIWDKGLWLIRNKNTPSMANALHIYYEFTYNEELDVFVYTFVRPYDD